MASTFRRSLSVSLGIILALIFSSSVSFMLFYYVRIPMPFMPTITDRLIFVFRWQMFSALALLLSIVTKACQLARDTSKTRNVNQPEFLLSTTNQVVLSFISHVAVATYVEESTMKVVPITSLLFIIGRSIYWFSRDSGLIFRTFGFVTAFGPIASVVLYGVFCLCYRGQGLRLGRPPIY